MKTIIIGVVPAVLLLIIPLMYTYAKDPTANRIDALSRRIIRRFFSNYYIKEFERCKLTGEWLEKKRYSIGVIDLTKRPDKKVEDTAEFYPLQ